MVDALCRNSGYSVVRDSDITVMSFLTVMGRGMEALMAQHVTEFGRGQMRGPKRRIATVIAIILMVALAVGGVLAAYHVCGVRQSSLNSSVNHLTELVRGTTDSAGSENAVDTNMMPASEADRKYPKAVSPVDFNENDMDDYADIVVGARKDAETIRPTIPVTIRAVIRRPTVAPALIWCGAHSVRPTTI